MSEEDFSLRDSLGIVGEIQPIIVDRNGNIVDGFHRKQVNEKWPVYRNEAIETPLQLAYARLASNTSRRRVPEEEIASLLSEIYEEHKKSDGEFPSPQLVAGNLGRSQDWVLKHLSDRYKSPTKVKAGKTGAEVSAIRRQTESGCISEKEQYLSQLGVTPEIEAKLVKEEGITFSRNGKVMIMGSGTSLTSKEVKLHFPEVFNGVGAAVTLQGLGSEGDDQDSASLSETVARRRPYAKGISPSAKEGLKAKYTEEHMKLAAAFNDVGLYPDVEKPFLREGEVTKEGKQKGYVADLHFGDQKVIIEVEGEGSASADNDDWELFFAENDYQVVHVPNACARSHGYVLAALARAFTRKSGES
ncbi:MAG: hypothetical protein ABSF83_14710 [Nitrososphaerales archaeon]